MCPGQSDENPVKTLQFSNPSILDNTLVNAACALASPLSSLNKNFKFLIQFLNMIKVNWNNVAKVLKFLATIITTVAGTLAVQSCAPHWF